jgi:hypothetical protein
MSVVTWPGTSKSGLARVTVILSAIGFSFRVE